MAGATDLERLVVTLSADVRSYQRSLDKARGITNKTARDIESRFKKMQRGIGSSFSEGFKGLAAGALSAVALNRIIDGVSQVITRLGDLNEQAEKVGTSAASLEALSAVAEQDGASIEEVIKALTKLNLEVGKAKATGKGKLFDLFDANDKKFSDDVIENFKTLADLAKNAPDEQTKALVASLGLGAKGFSNLLVTINRGSKDISKAMAEAVPDPKAFNEAAKQADEFGDKWKKAWRDFRNEVSLATVEIVELLDTLGAIGALENLTEGIKNFRTGLDALQSPVLLLKAALEQITGLNFGASEEFQREILKRTEGEIKVFTLKQQQLNVEKQIAELHNMGGGSSPRLRQLEAELRVLQQQLTVAEQIAQREGIARAAPQTGPAGPAGNIRFFQPQPTTIVGDIGDGETADSIKELTKTIDKFVDVVIDFENAGGRNLGKNPLSSAEGLGQFINSTFIDQFKKAFPGLANLSDPEILARRNDPDIALKLIKQYALENAKFLSDKLKIPLDSVTAAQLQLAHFLGAGGAAKVLGAPAGTPVENVLPPDVIAANRGVLAGKTTDQIVAEANARAGLVGVIREQRDALADLEQSTQTDIDQMKVKEAGLTAVTEKERIYARELELRQQLEAKGIPITDEVQAKIHSLAVSYEQQATSLKTVEDAQDAAKESAQELAEQQEALQDTLNQVGQAIGSSLQGFISDLIAGKDLTDALRDALINLGEQLLQIGLDNLFSALGAGGTGGGFLGALFGGATGDSGGLLSGLFHKGGIVGQGGGLALASSRDFTAAPRFHNGRMPGLRADEMAAILKKNEIVFPSMDALARTIRRYGSGSGRQGVVMNNTFIAPDWKSAIKSQNQIARTAGTQLERVQRTL